MCCGDPAEGSGTAPSSQGQAAPVCTPAAQAAPVYCPLHNQSEKRKKTKPVNRHCTSCKKEIQTNYVDFALCPGCSAAQNRCMCCGNPSVAPAPKGSARKTSVP